MNVGGFSDSLLRRLEAVDQSTSASEVGPHRLDRAIKAMKQHKKWTL